MANDVKRKTKRTRDRKTYTFLILAIIFLVFINFSMDTEEEEQNTSSVSILDNEATVETFTTENAEDAENFVVDGNLHVHMIDCGQGDSFLFEQNAKW